MRAAICFCFVLLFLAPALCFPADVATEPKDAPPAAEICFPYDDAKGILKDLEGYDACMDAVNSCDDSLVTEQKRADALSERVKEQDEQIVRAERLVEDTRKAGEQAAKGSWWSRLKSNAGYMGLGAIIALVAVLAL